MAKHSTTLYHQDDADPAEIKVHASEETAHKYARDKLKAFKGSYSRDGIYRDGKRVHIHSKHDGEGNEVASVHVEEAEPSDFAFKAQ